MSVCIKLHSKRPAAAQLVGVSLLLLLTSACASSARLEPGGAPAATDAAAQLRAEVARWRGTPHVWGGTTQQGADCSGFVQTVYRDLFAAALPRTTSDQVREGQAVRRTALRPGDLVFFRPAKRAQHVGIYLGEGEFAHVSSSQGVTISHLDETYWARAYWTARRLLARAPAVRATPGTEPAAPQTAPRPVPGGW